MKWDMEINTRYGQKVISLSSSCAQKTISKALNCDSSFRFPLDKKWTLIGHIPQSNHKKYVLLL